MTLADTAKSYLDAGLCVLPARADEKRPAVPSWKAYQKRLPTDAELRRWFGKHTALCIVTGAVSGNAGIMDFDNAAELYPAWRDRVESEMPGLADRLVRERSQGGGLHGGYRCEAPIPGGEKLAQRAVVTPDDKPVTIKGKTYKPRWVIDHWEVIIVLIETRGEGNLFLCAPSPGYVLEQGRFEELPVLTVEEREILMRAARSLDELPRTVEPIHQTTSDLGVRPGDAFNERGDVRAVLLKHGWTLVKPGENEYWARPEKERGWSATFRNRVLYCFSSNAAPFEEKKAYAPFSVYSLLEHNGDFARAASALRAEGYGSDSPAPDVDISALLPQKQPKDDGPVDPGPMPDEMLRIPGFISEVMEISLVTSPYPSNVMAFCGALALQSFLAGRKVRDSGDNRTNIYLLGLAHSSAGKDHPRKINSRILQEIGFGTSLGQGFASGEGIQDSLFVTPAMLFQTDEIDGILQSISKAKDARHEAIMSTLLTMYSSANSIYPMRRKAGKEPAGVIDQPSLTIFGTAIPNHYYEALSERMLTNGFFARMVIVEAGPRCEGQEPKIIELPPRVLETAKWWAAFGPGGNMADIHPVPAIVSYSDDAKKLLIENRQESEAEYSKAEANNDPVGTTVWGRVNEQTRKLALIYAVSENHTSPLISADAVRWASAFMTHQARRMLFMAQDHVADNPFHAECLKFLRKLREAPGHILAHSVLLKRMKIDANTFQQLKVTLVEQGDIEALTTPRAGSAKVEYRLLTGKKDGGETR